MKKLLLALAACAVSAAAMAQPMRPPPRDMDHRDYHRMHQRHKVWVPSHYEHGHRVSGHYVWR